jgi:hypothetical protein
MLESRKFVSYFDGHWVELVKDVSRTVGNYLALLELQDTIGSTKELLEAVGNYWKLLGTLHW